MFKVYYMRRLLCIVVLTFITICSVRAQEFTKSYGCVGVNTTMGAQAPPVGLATWIEFYDNYIMVMGIERFNYGGTNFDGSRQYWAVRQGQPAMNTVGWLVSKNYSSVKQVVESTMMGMTMQMEYLFNYIGEGSSAAQNMLGSSSGTMGDYDYDSQITCHSCHGSGLCKHCNGSGRYSYSRDGRCGVCRGTGRCAGCDGKGSY